MYGAALLETKNVKEYDDAAGHAAACGRDDFVPCLKTMADVELEHERYFKTKVREHRLGRHLPLPRCTRGAAALHADAAGSNKLNPDGVAGDAAESAIKR